VAANRRQHQAGALRSKNPLQQFGDPSGVLTTCSVSGTSIIEVKRLVPQHRRFRYRSTPWL
jgi:hypothetical protein